MDQHLRAVRKLDQRGFAANCTFQSHISQKNLWIVFKRLCICENVALMPFNIFFFPCEELTTVLGFRVLGSSKRWLGDHFLGNQACGSCEEGGMGHGVALSPEVAKRVLWACLAMPAAALAVRLYVDPVHRAHTHHAVELPMPPHVPPPVADLSEQQQQSADSS